MSAGAALVSFWVDGTPATQGSKSPGKGGYGFHESDKKLPAWRKAVTAAAEEMAGIFEGPLDFPMAVHLDVYLPAVKKSKFGRWPAGTPDLDKLQRAVGDGLTVSKLIKDDARICVWRARKHWAEEGGKTGARISIEDLRDELYIPAGELQQVELNLDFKLSGMLRSGLMGGVSFPRSEEDAQKIEGLLERLATVVAEPRPPMLLTQEAYDRIKAEKEIERRYGKGGL